MDGNNEQDAVVNNDDDQLKIPESPKPLAFTVDFGDGKAIDSQRHKNLFEKFQRKHRRGQSLSKLDEPSITQAGPQQSSSFTTKNTKIHPVFFTGYLPRKSSFQSEGYFSSDEKSSERGVKNVRCSSASKLKSELSLPLKNVTTTAAANDKIMTQSFPNSASSGLFSISSPSDGQVELKDVSSPELDMISPFSPRTLSQQSSIRVELKRQYSSPEQVSELNETITITNNDSTTTSEENFVDGTEFDFDKSDTASDTGTYTLDADNYSAEQKARMSIDREFKIEQISVARKTEEYIKSLSQYDKQQKPPPPPSIVKQIEELNLQQQKSSTTTTTTNITTPTYKQFRGSTKMLSPILSPTQNLSITQQPPPPPPPKETILNNEDASSKSFTKIMFPSPKSRNANGLEQMVDQGSVISVTSSGAFRSKNEKENVHVRRLSLTKSEIQVEAYVGDKIESSNCIVFASGAASSSPVANNKKKLTANLINVQCISAKHVESHNGSGVTSPTKIPSPMHSLSRPRSRNSINIELSDSSLETESYLKPTQNCINALQQKLSLDNSDQEESDFELNNTHQHSFIKQQKTTHNYNNDKIISNKLEHFQNKNLLMQGIDQTFSNMFNQYNQNRVVSVMHKIQNSPNNSPIRRSSSFSTKNQINLPAKNTNLQHQETNLRNSPQVARNTNTAATAAAIQRSASTANIKPNYVQQQRRSSTDQHQKIDRNQFGDTESSSEEDFEKSLAKKKDLSNLTNTRYNRTFSLRRARLDEMMMMMPPKCPNTPEMRRKFQPSEHHIRSERAISMDRKPLKSTEVQSRYLLNVTKSSKTGTAAPAAGGKVDQQQHQVKVNVPKGMNSNSTPVKVTASSGKPQVFSRTDSGRFSMRTGKPPPVASGVPKSTTKKEGGGKKSGRSNSSLSSREKEFQNWKRRKSYDPMKAAAEGKRKEMMAKKQNVMTQSYNEANNQDCDSSPSHSSSVHRSQSFHGTAALEQLISSEEEEDLTLSADEGFSPPTPSPCELSPARASLRNAWRDHVLH